MYYAGFDCKRTVPLQSLKVVCIGSAFNTLQMYGRAQTLCRRPSMIAKGRFFCNQIQHNAFIIKTLMEIFTSKNFKEKSFQNNPSKP